MTGGQTPGAIFKDSHLLQARDLTLRSGHPKKKAELSAQVNKVGALIGKEWTLEKA